MIGVGGNASAGDVSIAPTIPVPGAALVCSLGHELSESSDHRLHALLRCGAAIEKPSTWLVEQGSAILAHPRTGRMILLRIIGVCFDGDNPSIRESQHEGIRNVEVDPERIYQVVIDGDGARDRLNVSPFARCAMHDFVVSTLCPALIEEDRWL
jgi:hypothetical protein